MTAEWKYTLFYENGGKEGMMSFRKKEETEEFLKNFNFRKAR